MALSVKKPPLVTTATLVKVNRLIVTVMVCGTAHWSALGVNMYWALFIVGSITAGLQVPSIPIGDVVSSAGMLFSQMTRSVNPGFDGCCTLTVNVARVAQKVASGVNM